MPLIKASDAYPSGEDWNAATVRAFVTDQNSLFIDTIQELRDNDLEQARWAFVKETAGFYRLSLSSTASDDGDTVLRDSIGRRYLKVDASAVSQWADVHVADLSARDAYDGEAEGFVILVSDIGDGRAAFYTMGDGGSADWIGPAYLTPLGGSTAAADISVTPAGTIAATNAQAAIEELDSEKAAVTAIREKLTGNRTYYVRTDGNDGNTGLVNSSGGAFLTIGRANQAIGQIDFNGYSVTISIGAGTFSEQVVVPVVAGLTSFYNLVYSGAGATTIISAATGYQGAIQASLGAGCVVENMKIQNLDANGYGVLSLQRGWLRIGSGITIGSCAGACIVTQSSGSYILANAGFTVDADSGCLVRAIDQGGIQMFGGTVALGTRAFTTTIEARNLAFVEVNGVTFTGTVTGQRYNVGYNAVIGTNGAGASYIPGSTAGGNYGGGVYH